MGCGGREGDCKPGDDATSLACVSTTLGSGFVELVLGKPDGKPAGKGVPPRLGFGNPPALLKSGMPLQTLCLLSMMSSS